MTSRTNRKTVRESNINSITSTNVLKVPRYASRAGVGDEPGMEGNVIFDRSDLNFYGHDGTTWVSFGNDLNLPYMNTFAVESPPTFVTPGTTGLIDINDSEGIGTFPVGDAPTLINGSVSLPQGRFLVSGRIPVFGTGGSGTNDIFGTVSITLGPRAPPSPPQAPSSNAMVVVSSNGSAFYNMEVSRIINNSAGAIIHIGLGVTNNFGSAGNILVSGVPDLRIVRLSEN